MTKQITCKRCGKRFWAGQGGDMDGEDLCLACNPPKDEGFTILEVNPRVVAEIEATLASDITVADGKYTMRKLEDGSWTALRYGEAWPAFKDVGPDNLHVALTIEIIELRKQLEVLQRPANDHQVESIKIKWVDNVGYSIYGDVYRVINITTTPRYILHRNGMVLISDWTGTFEEAQEAAQEDVNRIYRSRKAVMQEAKG